MGLKQKLKKLFGSNKSAPISSPKAPTALDDPVAPASRKSPPARPPRTDLEPTARPLGRPKTPDSARPITSTITDKDPDAHGLLHQQRPPTGAAQLDHPDLPLEGGLRSAQDTSRAPPHSRLSHASGHVTLGGHEDAITPPKQRYSEDVADRSMPPTSAASLGESRADQDALLPARQPGKHSPSDYFGEYEGAILAATHLGSSHPPRYTEQPVTWKGTGIQRDPTPPQKRATTMNPFLPQVQPIVRGCSMFSRARTYLENSSSSESNPSDSSSADSSLTVPSGTATVGPHLPGKAPGRGGFEEKDNRPEGQEPADPSGNQILGGQVSSYMDGPADLQGVVDPTDTADTSVTEKWKPGMPDFLFQIRPSQRTKSSYTPMLTLSSRDP